MKYGRAIFVGVLAVLGLAGCQDRDFLNINDEKARNPLLNCRCPSGFTMNPGADGCTRELKVDPTGAGNGRMIEVGDSVASYLNSRLHFTNADASTDWPLSFEPYTGAKDRSGVALPETITPVTPFWRDRVLATNRISIKSETYIWHTKTVCIDIQREKTYTIFIGADNLWNLKIDGLDYAKCEGSYCFVDGRFMSQTLKSGKHLVEMKYLDEGSYGALWYEVYDQSLDSVRAATKESDLSVLFSTRSLIGQTWDFGGEICPPGYAYDVCAGDKKCTKLEQSACL